MVILLAGVETVEELEIEVEAIHRRLALLEAIERAWRNRDGRESGRAAKALLRATISYIDAVLIHQHWHAAERGHAVADRQRVDFVCRVADGLGLVEHAGGGLGLYE